MDYKRETADNRRLPAVYFCTGGEARTLCFKNSQNQMLSIKQLRFKIECLLSLFVLNMSEDYLGFWSNFTKVSRVSILLFFSSKSCSKCSNFAWNSYAVGVITVLPLPTAFPLPNI